jgi:hypothetical protein
MSLEILHVLYIICWTLMMTLFIIRSIQENQHMPFKVQSLYHFLGPSPSNKLCNANLHPLQSPRSGNALKYLFSQDSSRATKEITNCLSSLPFLGINVSVHNVPTLDVHVFLTDSVTGS